jgi:FtsZ-binding cell division protein ZapB
MDKMNKIREKMATLQDEVDQLVEKNKALRAECDTHEADKESLKRNSAS